ncbi:MAG: methionine--tRNA ligase [Deltaproteobacteria bacterium]|nr:methionine--tRNA ligase [Deltaproteobacteria bacterium]
MPERFYVTTPIYYVNDKPHIGHAYCTILADVAARAHRLLGDQTYLLTGTDEHGQKVQEAAARRGIDPQAHCDELHAAFKAVWPRLLCEPDQFIRTTEPRHKAVVQRALQRLHDRGLVVPREFEGWYCVPDERFWTEKELQDGNCPSCGRQVVRLKEKNWFFKMGQYQSVLRDAITSGAIAIHPAHRANEVLGFLDKPLQDLCISRPSSRLSWGIALPFDPDYVTYVWFDALLNYATAIGFLDAEPPTDGSRWPDPAATGAENYAAWWPHVAHFLGKDILTTHAVYWPTMLMGLAEAFDRPREAWLPRTFLATGWFLVDSTKMSKSLGNVVSPLDITDRYGPEALRWFVLREMVVGQDANFSEEAVVRRNNVELANDLGNLVQRTVALVEKWFDGKVPSPASPDPTTASQAAVRELAEVLLRPATAADVADPVWTGDRPAPAAVSIRSFRLHRLAADGLALVGRLNELIQHDAPFRTVRDNPAAAGQTLYCALEGLRIAATLLQPLLPSSAPEILRRVGAGGSPVQLAGLQWGQLSPGAAVASGAPLFAKHEYVAPVTAAPAAPTATQPSEGAAAPSRVQSETSPPRPDANPARPDVPIDQFAALDLRVGSVLVAEAVPKSSKLLRLEIDLGEAAPRQILSGIAESFAPAELVGQQVLVLANLAPRKMMGLQSHGMVLVSEGDQGRRVLVQPARPVAAGAGVR